MVVDTACSSSLVTVHLAAQALRRGECSLALAGGVNLTLGSGTTTALERLSMLSPDGHCKAFDARADGFVRGEGCGVVVLKLLAEAEAAGDRILAVIRGTAVNQDGRSSGLTAPNGASQEAVIRAALSSGGVAPDAVDYVEAHGTGTALGDPIEMHALAGVFGGRTRELLVGSVKTNIGHAEAAAGVAGLVKAALALRHQAVPASLHFERLNPHIELGQVPISVPARLTPRDLRFAGVSSFGFSGTNAHVVLERGAILEPPPWSPASGDRPTGAHPGPDSATPPLDAPDTAGRDPGRAEVEWVPGVAFAQPRPEGAGHQLLISARTPQALGELIAGYQALLGAGVPFPDLCHSAAIGRAVMRWWVCVDRPEALGTAQPSDAPPPELRPQPGRRVDLPLYPFQRQPYWAHPKRPRPSVPRGAHPLLGRRLRSSLAQRQYEAMLAPDEPAWLGDHAVGGRVIVPAAALIEMMLAAIPGDGPIALTGVAFQAMLAPADQPLVQTVADPTTGSLVIAASRLAEDASFQTIASAMWEAGETIPDPELGSVRGLASRSLDLPALYQRFEAAGLSYGPAFRRLRALRGGPGFAVVDLPDSQPGFRLDPLVLDAAWQGLAAALPPDSTGALMPIGVDRLIWRGGIPRTSVLRLVAPDRAEVALLDEAGEVVAWCEGLRLSAALSAAAGIVIRATVWAPVPLGDDTPDWIDCREETDPVAACWRVLDAYRATGDHAPRLGVLSRGATEAGGTIPVPAQAALVGLVATLGRERPELRPVLLDLDGMGEPPPVPATCGPVLAWRDGELLAPRAEAKDAAPQPAAPFVLARGEAATLDGLRWVPATRRSPSPGEVEIEIAAAGMNFRDVMNLLGVYPGDGGAPGVECSGTVAAIGEGVTSFAPGDPVVAIAPGCFASHVIADERLVSRVPVTLDWRELAGQVVAMLTARLALEDEAGIRPGQRVLIHAATGGVGLAAAALARQRGAQVVATAGSAAKRAHLAALGVREVHDSRSLDFATAVRPVDVVLNSLTGPAIPAGLRLLRPGGFFLELGKAEIWTEAQVKAVRPDVRYVPVALDQVILAAPARVGAMLRHVVDALANGIPGLPVTPHAFGDITEALRCLQGARHIGKLVLSRTLLRGDASYVISGGTGALGRHLARWLAGRGARHLVLLARRPEPVEVPGATVRTIAVDVSDEPAVRRALSGLPHPVKGVFHLAASLHDATADRMTRDQLAAAFAAKLRGAEVLDRVTSDMRLDQFVLFGSLAAIAGSPGQANYAAANAALEAVVRRRRGPAVLVDWGAWQGEGMAQGLSGPALPPEAALAAMDGALSGGLRRVSVSAALGPAAPAVTPLAERLAGAIGAGKLDLLAEAVNEIASRILGLGELALEPTRPLTELGLDSLMAVELRNALGAAVGRTLPTSLVFDHPTAEALSAYLARELGIGTAAGRVPHAAGAESVRPPASVGVSVPTTTSEPLDGMDDEAALLLLERKLSHAGY